MSNKLITGLLITFCIINTEIKAADSNGIVKLKSVNSVTETINKLVTVLNNKGMTIFKRIDHAAGAKNAGLQLRATELLIFGKPRVGTPLMLCSQTAALDLPQKALAYEDEKGQVWLIYNDPGYMVKRHNITGCEKAIQKVTNALARFSKTATE